MMYAYTEEGTSNQVKQKNAIDGRKNSYEIIIIIIIIIINAVDAHYYMLEKKAETIFYSRFAAERITEKKFDLNEEKDRERES